MGRWAGGQPQAPQRPGLGGTVAAGVVLALLVKAVRSYEATHGGGIGGLLGSLGCAGALGALIEQFRQKGYGQQVDSWVAHGSHQPMAPPQVADALGENTVQALQKQTGMPRETLLADLSHLLPQALDEATPQGRVPNDQELHQIVRQPTARRS